MTPTQIEDFLTDARAKIAADKDGTSTVLYDQLKTIEDYQAKLKADLKKDPILAASKEAHLILKQLISMSLHLIQKKILKVLKLL